MQIRTLHIMNYKNLRSIALELHPRFNFIVGENGMGKTNFLDALYYTAVGRSYFNATGQRELILEGENFLRIQLELQHKEKSQTLVIKMPLDGKREIVKNGSTIERIGAHVGFLPVVFVTPDDGFILLSGSTERRRWMNRTLSMESSEYFLSLKNYNKLLKQRNALLRSAPFGADLSQLLSTYDEQMERYATVLFHTRSNFIEQLNPLVRKYYETISEGKETIEIGYASQLDGALYVEIAKQAYAQDLNYRRTTVGPHKDDLIIKISGKKMKRYASQGQLKSFVLALKLAEYHFLKLNTGKSPLLLIDDIFAKLDGHRVRALLEFLLRDLQGQVFITDTDLDRMKKIVPEVGMPYSAFEMNDGDLKVLED